MTIAKTQDWEPSDCGMPGARLRLGPLHLTVYVYEGVVSSHFTVQKGVRTRLDATISHAGKTVVTREDLDREAALLPVGKSLAVQLAKETLQEALRELEALG